MYIGEASPRLLRTSVLQYSHGSGLLVACAQVFQERTHCISWLDWAIRDFSAQPVIIFDPTQGIRLVVTQNGGALLKSQSNQGITDS